MKEVAALWREIDAWFDEHGATRMIEARRPGATAAALRALEQKIGVALPADLRASLRIHDGGGCFESYELLGARAIGGTWAAWHELATDGTLKRRGIADPAALKTWWRDRWIPFAQDSCGNLRCVDTAGAGRLIALETQDAQGAYPMKTRRFVDWLRAYRDRLVDGSLAVDEEGFVDEPVVKPSVEPTGPKPPELDAETSEALRELIERGKVAEIRKLLDRGAFTVEHALQWGRSMLGVACEHDRLAVVKLLVDRGMDVDFGRARGERTPLFEAAWGPNARPAIVKYLLAKGADPNAMTRYDGTPLFAAAMFSQPDIVTLLLAAGADPAARNAEGKTILDGRLSDRVREAVARWTARRGAPRRSPPRSARRPRRRSTSC